MILPQVDRALLRKDELRKHLEWRLCGNAVSNVSKTSGMRVKLFINIYYIHLSLPTFLTAYSCLAFSKYTGISKFPFRALVVLQMCISSGHMPSYSFAFSRYQTVFCSTYLGQNLFKSVRATVSGALCRAHDCTNRVTNN
jgi:hypothetical protein